MMAQHVVVQLAAGLAILGSTVSIVAGPVEPLPFCVPAKMPDVAEVLSPSAVTMGGWLGRRIDANATHRLLNVDTEPLLAGFRAKPGRHPWIGEHVGKWMHAATLAWANTGSAALREKLDHVAAELIKAQEPDGYLGTYVPEKRFGLFKGADWDVWSHKYNLLGLLTYYQYTGNQAALTACRKMGDLLVATFPAKKSILAAGTHMGMASTSVLEPMVLLYRLTGEERYLDFARYLVQSWDEPQGPKIVATLLTEKRVNKTANGKAYEMLSNLVGLCELARVTGDHRLLEAVLNAWEDIVCERLYITGTASQWEHFQADRELRNDPAAHVGETCVTVTWIQLNLQLLRLTGKAWFGDELDRTFYNHLPAAQHPEGEDWCYYTALEGRKPYDKGITCCHSSGPRGMALVPQASYLRGRTDGRDVLWVSTLETSRVTLPLGGQPVTVHQESDFPLHGRSVLRLELAQPATFVVRVRVPAWARSLQLSAGDRIVEAGSGWAEIPARLWTNGDRITLTFSLEGRLVEGHDSGNHDRAALLWGPFVLACDEQLNPKLPPLRRLGLVDAHPPLTVNDDRPLMFQAKVVEDGKAQPTSATFVPFANAGAEGSTYRVWLRAPGVASPADDNLAGKGQESHSRPGNVRGSINDDEPSTFVVTFDGKPASKDWFALTFAEPVKVRRITFAHGKTFHDGGWFDARSGKPWVQVQRDKTSSWETVGKLGEYPDTTETDPKGLKPGQTFTLRLSEAMEVIAVRVAGVPACGDRPQQAFSSCGELQVFGTPGETR